MILFSSCHGIQIALLKFFDTWYRSIGTTVYSVQSELPHHQFVLRSSLPSVRCIRFLLNYSFLFRPIPLFFFRGRYCPSIKMTSHTHRKLQLQAKLQLQVQGQAALSVWSRCHALVTMTSVPILYLPILQVISFIKISGDFSFGHLFNSDFYEEKADLHLIFFCTHFI